MKYNIHPIADLFPALDDASYAQLRDDIKKNGILNAVWTFRDNLDEEPRIIDGRIRAMIAEELNIELPSHCYEGPDPLKFLISQNLVRRHLNESQRAMIAASFSNMRRGGFHGNQYAVSANLQTPQITQAKAAALFKVSPRLVSDAVSVRDHAVQEVI